MNKNIRWKVITILTVLVIFTVLGVYPIVASMYHLPMPGWLQQKQLKLGFDLKAGVHLVMRVQTDDAIPLETDQAAERLREALRMRTIPVKIVEGGPAANHDDLLQGGKMPEGMDIVAGNADASGGGTVYYLVRKAAAVSGHDLTNARPSVDQNNLPAVSFTLSSEGARKFGAVTESNIGRRLA